MFSMAKVTKINYMADDFSKEFVGQQEKYTVKATTHKQRNQPNRMNDAGLLVCLLYTSPSPRD